MRTPRWLADELTDAVKKVSEKMQSPRDAVEHLTGVVYEKDEEWVVSLIKERITSLFDGRMRARRRLAVREMERRVDDVIGSARQLGFDDVCSYYFPPDTFPPSTPLAEAVAWAHDLLGRAERHKKVAEARVKFAEQLLGAVGGNDQATLGAALTALRDSGSAAAEG